MNWWIRDPEGRVLGPVSLPVLSDLVRAGRLHDIASVSRDGRAWRPPSEFGEVQSLLAQLPPTDAREQELARLREYQSRIRKAEPHDVFRVERTASADEYRAAFFRTVKRFHPERAPAGDLELRRAYEEVFLYLAGLMVQLEHKKELASKPLPRVPQVRAMTPLATYRPVEFVGLRWRAEGSVEARVRVRAAETSIFTSHPVVNFETDGCFFAGQKSVPLGTPVELTLHFDEPYNVIRASTKVVWENLGSDELQPRGFGVRWYDLQAQDREFIQRFIGRATPASATAAPTTRLRTA